jgi:iron complex outermembrane receptor protein
MNPLAAAPAFHLFSTTTALQDHKLTGLARVSYDIDKNNMVFASVSTGYKSGGLQDGGVHTVPKA